MEKDKKNQVYNTERKGGDVFPFVYEQACTQYDEYNPRCYRPGGFFPQ